MKVVSSRVAIIYGSKTYFDRTEGNDNHTDRSCLEHVVHSLCHQKGLLDDDNTLLIMIIMLIKIKKFSWLRKEGMRMRHSPSYFYCRNSTCNSRSGLTHPEQPRGPVTAVRQSVGAAPSGLSRSRPAVRRVWWGSQPWGEERRSTCP